VLQAAVVDVEMSDISVDLPGAPGPLLSARRVAVAGPVISARQATVSEPDHPLSLPLLVGSRRAAPARSPDAPPRPPVKLYTDLDIQAGSTVHRKVPIDLPSHTVWGCGLRD